MSLQNLFSLILKGGPGSGNWGHSGVKGRRGGSAPKGGGLSGSNKPKSQFDFASQADYILGRSKSQRKKDIATIAKKPMKELRKNQDIIKSQIERAYQQKNDKALEALQQMADDYMYAVMSK